MSDQFPAIGTVVRVVRGISDTEKHLAKHPERIFKVLRYTKPHGYAVIREKYERGGFDAGDWHVHPEALEEVTQ